MSASQDKVQSILQSVLEDSLPLVHKGVFTHQQLQNAMCERQKHENNMLKPTYKLSDYLKAIEFQYAFERQRRNRIQTLAPTNPLFKKQAKTDFVIIKRIIKLWDRTMHKFKYDIELWKQYLDFCIKSSSKKQFYKALSFALRFVPFSEDLWMIGVHYEIQIGMNLWKARKIFLKALRMNSKKVNLWVQMFKFEINFLKTIHEREKAIQGNETMYFVQQKNQHNVQEEEHQKEERMVDQQDDEHVKKYNDINLEEHDDILVMVYEQALSKIQETDAQQFIGTINKILTHAINDEKDKTLITILKRAHKKIQQIAKQYRKQHASLKKQPKPTNNPHLIPSTQNLQQKVQYHKQYLLQNKMISTIQLDKIISQFLTKPIHLTQLLTYFIKVNKHRAIQYMLNSTKFKIQYLPGKVIESIIQSIDDNEQELKKYQKTVSDIIKKINPNTYIQYLPLMETVIRFNKKVKNFKANTDIHRSITILCKNHPQIIERCLHWIHIKNDLDLL